MKKKLLAFLLALTLGVGGLPTMTVKAENNGGVVNIDEKQDDVDNANAKAEEKQNQESENLEENESNGVEASGVNFAVVSLPYVQVPQIQRIAVSIGDETSVVENPVLRYRDIETQEIFEISSDEAQDNIFAFSIDYNDPSINATYELVDISYIIDGVEKQWNFLDNSMKIQYGVNRQIETEADGEFVETDTEELEQNVVVTDEEGNEISEDSIEEVINSAIESSPKEVSLSRARGGEVVVVLDPGHGGNDSGALGNGYRECDLNLKIAQYAKEELEQYTGIKVYMTREDDSTVDLKERTNYAYRVGADLFVSIHLNSGVSSAHGAEVYYPNSNNDPFGVGEKGHQVAEKIQDNLVALGLFDRKTKYRNTVEDKYPDGSLQDYYSVIRESKLHGFPGIIIEHAFISNSQDVAQFLNSTEKLKALGVADAEGIAEYFGLQKGGPIPDGTYVINTAVDGHKVMEVADGSMDNGGNVQIWDNENKSSQRFEITYVGDGYYKIIAEHSDKSLDVEGGSSAAGANLQQRGWDGSDGQLWKIIEAGENTYKIQSKLGTYIDLDNHITDNGHNIHMHVSTNDQAQMWQFTESSYKPIQNGTYTITSALDSKKAIEVQDESVDDNALIHINSMNENLSSQFFEIYYVSGGYYKIVNEKSGKVLTADGDSNANFVSVQQETWRNSSGQLWKFVDTGTGKYVIKSKLGTCLDLPGASTENKTNIQMYACNYTDAQKWQLNANGKETVNEGTYYIASGLNAAKVLDVAGGNLTDKGNVDIWSKNNSKAQQFKISYVENGYYKIENVNSGKVLDVDSASVNAGANLQQYTYNGSDAQLWKFVEISEGVYSIKSKLGTTINLLNGNTTNGINVNLDTYQYNLARQTWKLRSVRNDNGQIVEDGIYTLYSAAAKDMVMDIDSGRTDDFANVQLYQSNETLAQKFRVEYNGNGFYKIMNWNSGKSLDVAGASDKEGANLQQYTYNGSDAQLWEIYDAGNGYYYVVSNLGTCIDLASGSVVNGANIQMADLSGKDTQKWLFEKTETVQFTEGTYVISNFANAKKVLDVDGASNTNGANIQLYGRNNSSAQRYKIEVVDGRYYRIIVEGSGKVLDVASGSANTGANLQQYEWNGSDAQLWEFIDAGDGSYYIVSKLGTCISTAGNATSDGTNAEMKKISNLSAQKWNLRLRNEKQSIRPVEDGTYIIKTKVNGTSAMDVTDGSSANLANIQLWEATGSAVQGFEIDYVENGYYKIINVNSGKSLDVKDISREPGANLQQHQWNGGESQLWEFIDTGDGCYYIESMLGTRIDLANGNVANGTNIQMYTPNNSVAQRWILEKKDFQIIDSGVYTIASQISRVKVMDIEGANKNNGAAVQLYTQNSSSAQQFKIDYVGGGYYKIENVSSKKVLDVPGGDKSDGVKLQQYDYNGTDAQLWKFIKTGNNSYFIQSKLGTYLDLPGASTSDFTKIQTYAFNGSDAQQWDLVSPTLTPIMGNSTTTVQQMVNYFNSKASYPEYYQGSDAKTIQEFCQIYYDECKTEGVRAEVAFSQAMNETGFLRFGGDVDISQYNFAGLGATGNGNPGNKFPNVRTGIRAQVQHLKAYASTDALKNGCVDSRFNYVKRGCAPYVEWLGIHENPNGSGWASAYNYGYNIVNIYMNELKKF